MRLGLVLLMGLLCAGCETASYKLYEQFGYEKRDLLVSRVESAMDAQEDAKEEFLSAFEQFEAVVGVPESDLKSVYSDLSDAFDDAESRAEAVSDRIDAVENVSEDLFEEWADEAQQISNASMRRTSQQQLEASKRRYSGLIKAMRQAESRMAPVLTTFRDHVLFLKHNLNAQAIASLKTELDGIESNVGRLIQDMEASIAQAQDYIAAETRG
ncbi:MAG: DUF2959 domain-containing protein [Pseudomonadota bacterium]